MDFEPLSSIYFIVVIPVLFIIAQLIKKEIIKKNNKKIIFYLVIATFFVRFFLVFFKGLIGSMPHLKETVFFYLTLSIFGNLIAYFYITKYEEKKIGDYGFLLNNWKISLKRAMIWSIPLLLMFPLILFAGNLQLSFPNWERFVIATAFGLGLGGFYEEVMFRGVIQMRLKEEVGEKQIIKYMALIFTATHIFYLPLEAHGLYYIFVFVMGYILSYIKEKYDDLFACSLLHGGIVFIMILFVI